MKNKRMKTKTFSGTGITSIIDDHNTRVELKRNRTHTKTFIGGMVIGIISHDIYIHLLPYINTAIDTLLAYLMK